MKRTKIFKFFGQKNKKFVFWGHVLSVCTVLFVLLLAQITQLFIDTIHTSAQGQATSFGIFWNILAPANLNLGEIVLCLVIAFMLIAILKIFSTFGASQCYYTSSSRARSALRRACFKKLAFMDSAPAARQTFFNLTSDVTDFADVLYRHRPKMFESMARIVLASIFCLLIDPLLSVGFLTFVPIILILGYLQRTSLHCLFSEARERKSDMFATSEEMISQVRHIKTFGAENWATEKYSGQNALHTSAITNAWEKAHKRKILLSLIRASGIFTAFLLCGISCFSGVISVGYFVLFITYAIIIFDACIQFTTSYQEYKSASVSASRLGKFLAASTQIKKQTTPLAPNFDIEFKNLSLILDGQQIFSNLSFRIPFSTHISIFAASAQGKTAIARLLLRFITQTSGEVLLASNPAGTYNISSLRQGFSYIPQEPAIFEGRVVDNITMFAKPDPQKLTRALKISGLETTFSDSTLSGRLLSESGKNLPAQVRQKIAIARAVYRDAPVLLIDNAFAKFPLTEAEELLERLRTAWRGKTVVFLTENPALSQKFKKVIKISSGEVKK